MKSLLNKYIYKSNKEFYNCNVNIIINKIKKCLNIENNCDKNNQIKTGGNNNIIDEINNNIIKNYIEYYENKYNKYLNYCKIIL